MKGQQGADGGAGLHQTGGAVPRQVGPGCGGRQPLLADPVAEQQTRYSDLWQLWSAVGGPQQVFDG